jgi:hypothetical protein
MGSLVTEINPLDENRNQRVELIKNRRRRAASWCALLVAAVVLVGICAVRFREYKREQFINSFSPAMRGMVKGWLRNGESDDQVREHVTRYTAETTRKLERTRISAADSASGLKFNQDTQ